jgi:hypothetical protein
MSDCLNALDNTDSSSGGTLGSDINDLISFTDSYIVPLLFAVAFIVFLWGVFNYFIWGGDNAEKQSEGRTYIMYGLIGFVIMVCVWGIVNLLVGSFGFDKNTRPDLPCFEGSNCNQTP